MVMMYAYGSSASLLRCLRSLLRALSMLCCSCSIRAADVMLGSVLFLLSFLYQNVAFLRGVRIFTKCRRVEYLDAHG